jgi:hypothetical protein
MDYHAQKPTGDRKNKRREDGDLTDVYLVIWEGSSGLVNRSMRWCSALPASQWWRDGIRCCSSVSAPRRRRRSLVVLACPGGRTPRRSPCSTGDGEQRIWPDVEDRRRTTDNSVWGGGRIWSRWRWQRAVETAAGAHGLLV